MGSEILVTFFIPGYNTKTYGRNSPRYVGPVIWSKLSKDGKKRRINLQLKKKILKVPYLFDYKPSDFYTN